MSEFVLIAGIGILLFIVAYVMFKLNRQSVETGRNANHFLLQLFLFIMLFSLVALLGKATVDGRDECAWNTVNSTISGATTTYGYEYQCEADTNNTSDTFFNVTTWIFRIGLMYIFLYFVYEALLFLNVQIPFVEKVVEKMNRKKENNKGYGGDEDSD